MDFRDFPLLDNLNDTQKANLESACEFSEIAPGERLIAQGERENKLFFVLRGRVAVRLLAGECESTVAVLEAPAIVGEMELLTNAPRSASVYAQTDCYFGQLDFDSIRTRLEDGDPASLKFIYRVAQVLAGRVAAVSRKLSELEACHPEDAEDLMTFRAKVFTEWNV